MIVVAACSPSPAPDQVTGVTAGLSGGSEEVAISWDASVASDLDHYNVYFSLNPEESKELLSDVPGTETTYIDHPRDLVEGFNCYEVTAVDSDGNESEPSDEACFSAT